ncbi:glucose-6-phosphate dehydrogenase [Listeria booriae]|uniref:Glucose-6-phosphate 1-dehydrogenase n=1 Tax=Listeria booriae TaxID=1552123 RepID=A0A099W976_9LIST|nr:glucose-6-phosphate dehydrogenase [Listeria booriae]KGL40680.1 glucose-6-phosphate dehydrogenase [Listeria booriae]MBC1209844.1 glucose-6-phosphate dehydrogenase [Listeria booriae]MBC1226067.1 glucose-6-phosphate dehydrogenase [Listeria booriae]MBC1229120.1 glucose-6-phosphate dehydrogenase [Listeria booriae]MBC1232774.1 glucose-6-phosphate dehydrogenase [Listeria booriae]
MTEVKEQVALITIFGGTGDLANRKLYPSLYHLFTKGFLKENFAVIGTARRPWTNDFFREKVVESLKGIEEEGFDPQDFASHFYYQSHDVTNRESYVQLKDLSDELDKKYELQGNRLFYLAMAPNFFGTIASRLKSEGFVDNDGFSRLIIEKPFGRDLASAQELNESLRQAFAENEIYRIDHYLGKEMIQNISVIRFANSIIESLWNNRYIDNVQVTLSETLGVEDRGRYYEESGALRDMVQNHILQIVSLLAMEPPIKLTTQEIRHEKVRALRSLRVIEGEDVYKYFVRGQYGPGTVDGEQLEGYRQAENVDPDSNTETFVAAKLMIDNFRWSGVPFYIRTGKRLAKKATQIAIQFKSVPMNLFGGQQSLAGNVLVIHIQPDEGITLHMNVKEPGQGMLTMPINLNYAHSSPDGMNTPEAYEKLIQDCLNGDATYFSHWDEVSLSWNFVDKVANVWSNTKEHFPNYTSGTMGPKEADKLVAQDGFEWFE